MNLAWPRLLVVIPALNKEETIATVVRDARTHCPATWSSSTTARPTAPAPGPRTPAPRSCGCRTTSASAARAPDRAALRLRPGVQPGGPTRWRRSARRLGGEAAPGHARGRLRPRRRQSLPGRIRTRSLPAGHDADAVADRLPPAPGTDHRHDQRLPGHRPPGHCPLHRHYPVDYLSDTVEALLLAGSAGLRVTELDVAMRPRQGGVPSAPGVKGVYHLTRLMVAIGLNDRVKRVPVGAGTA